MGLLVYKDSRYCENYTISFHKEKKKEKIAKYFHGFSLFFSLFFLAAWPQPRTLSETINNFFFLPLFFHRSFCHGMNRTSFTFPWA